MKTFKGTKGEWKVDLTNEHEADISCNGLRIAQAKHYRSCDLNDPPIKEGRANAKLITAAPELLNELIWEVEFLEGLLNDGLEMNQAHRSTINSRLNYLNAAINKAL